MTRNNRAASAGVPFTWRKLVTAGVIAACAPAVAASALEPPSAAERIERSIDLPVKNLTSVSFGGPELDVLYVTSMRRIAHPTNGKFSRPIAPEPLAGGLWQITGLGIRGPPEPRYGG